MFVSYIVMLNSFLTVNLGLYLLEIEITITEKFNNFLTFPSATFDYGKPGFNCILSFPMELCQSYNHLASSDLFMHIRKVTPRKMSLQNSRRNTRSNYNLH